MISQWVVHYGNMTLKNNGETMLETVVYGGLEWELFARGVREIKNYSER